MIWTILLGVTGLLAGWFNPVSRELVGGRSRPIIRWYAWLFLFLLVSLTCISTWSTQKSAKQAHDVRAQTLDLVIAEINLARWKAEKRTEIEKLAYLTRLRSRTGKELNQSPSLDPLTETARYAARMRTFEENFSMASESIKETISAWEADGFSQESLAPLARLLDDVESQAAMSRNAIHPERDDEAREKWNLDLFHERVQALENDVKLHAQIALDFEYSRRLSLDVNNKGESRELGNSEAKRPGNG